MPNYEYHCNNDECSFDRFTIIMSMRQMEKLGDPNCPNCGQPAVRVFSPFSGRFGDTRKFHDR